MQIRIRYIRPDGQIVPAQLCKARDGALSLEMTEKDRPDEQALYLGAPWIDAHCHVFEAVTSFGLSPDSIGLQTGVHLLVDAGSAGAETIEAFLRYVKPAARTKLRAFLNISRIGLVTMREYFDARLLDVDAAVKTIEKYPDFLCGIKVRSSGQIVESQGLLPLRRAAEAAEKARRPILMHIGETPPTPEENLPLLRRGDIVTHCFHGKDRPLWHPDGRPIEAMKNALNRGVLLDVGHGAASFDATVAEAVIRRGGRQFSISTDLHGRSLKKPVCSLAHTMSKFLALGMPLGEVVRAVTEIPARYLRLEGWCDAPQQNATLFRLRPAARGESFVDAAGHELPVRRAIEPVALLLNGYWIGLAEGYHSFDEVEP